MSKIFPKSANALPLQIVIFLFVLGSVATAAVTYYSTPKYLRVGYQPIQPVPFDHSLHAGNLAIDCRYCHASVEKSATSSVPTAQTCMNCHSIIKPQSPLLEPVRKSYETGEPVPWVKIHQAPDYVYFNHSVHVDRGVSCVECHGKVNEMSVVWHDKSHSMGFCLDCHRDPASRIRKPEDVFNLNSKTVAEQAGLEEAHKMIKDWKVKPPQSCSGCHR
ncbi:cytochrome c3 family protein [Oleiharenicola sp. Vm1]|uniref:cytochrome c3 family protein n=1 Tax=Oleiharenicola sp. Vm1 TaxID=3398393 RepID=UPI0039F5520F